MFLAKGQQKNRFMSVRGAFLRRKAMRRLPLREQNHKIKE